MAVHRPLGEEQLRRDLPVAQSLRDQLRHLELTRPQLVQGVVLCGRDLYVGLAQGEAHRRLPRKSAAGLEFDREPRRPQGLVRRFLGRGDEGRETRHHRRPSAQADRLRSAQQTFVGVGAAAIQHRSAGGLRAIGHFLGTKAASIIGKNRVMTLFIAALNNEDLTFLGDLLQSGKVVPAIDRRYELSSVPEALVYMNEGHARAKVAIRVG